MTQKPSLNRMTEFVDALRGSGLKAEGWDIFAVFSQAHLESGGFQCELTEKAYNVFGLKGNYKGKSYEVLTPEIIPLPKTLNLMDAVTVKKYLDEVVVKGWKKEYKLVKIMVINGYPQAKVLITDKFKLFPGFDCTLQDYVAHLKELWPKAYEGRGSHITLFNGIVTLLNGKCVYPSWSTSPTYPQDLCNRYDRLKAQNFGELYQLVTG